MINTVRPWNPSPPLGQYAAIARLSDVALTDQYPFTSVPSVTLAPVAPVDRWQPSARTVFKIGGGVAGAAVLGCAAAYLGANVGFAVGLMIPSSFVSGPIINGLMGIAYGEVIGGVLGLAGGAYLGAKAGEALYDYAHGPVQSSPSPAPAPIPPPAPVPASPPAPVPEPAL